MKRIILIFFVLLYSLAFSEDQKKGLVNNESFCFLHKASGQKISFGSDVKILTKTLGRPKQTSETINEIKFRKISWTGCDIHVIPKKIILIVTLTDSSFSTIDGISVGDTKDAVIKEYGQPIMVAETYIQYYYSSFEETWFINFFIDDDKVESIQMHRLD